MQFLKVSKEEEREAFLELSWRYYRERESGNKKERDCVHCVCEYHVCEYHVWIDIWK